MGTSVPFNGPSGVPIVPPYAPDTPYCSSSCLASIAWTSRLHAVTRIALSSANASAVMTFMLFFLSTSQPSLDCNQGGADRYTRAIVVTEPRDPSGYGRLCSTP